MTSLLKCCEITYVVAGLDGVDASPMLSSIDWPLLVFFSSLFIDVKSFSATGYVESAWNQTVPYISLKYGPSSLSEHLFFRSNEDYEQYCWWNYDLYDGSRCGIELNQQRTNGVASESATADSRHWY